MIKEYRSETGNVFALSYDYSWELDEILHPYKKQIRLDLENKGKRINKEKENKMDMPDNFGEMLKAAVRGGDESTTGFKEIYNSIKSGEFQKEVDESTDLSLTDKAMIPILMGLIGMIDAIVDPIISPISNSDEKAQVKDNLISLLGEFIDKQKK